MSSMAAPPRSKRWCSSRTSHQPRRASISPTCRTNITLRSRLATWSRRTKRRGLGRDSTSTANRSKPKPPISIIPASDRRPTTSAWRLKIPIAAIHLPPVALKLKSGQTPQDAAWLLLGDRRLVNEIHSIGEHAYVRGERLGPPARWAASPPKLEQDGQVQQADR